MCRRKRGAKAGSPTSSCATWGRSWSPVCQTCSALYARSAIFLLREKHERHGMPRGLLPLCVYWFVRLLACLLAELFASLLSLPAFCFCLLGVAWRGVAWRGLAWRGFGLFVLFTSMSLVAWLGLAWLGLACLLAGWLACLFLLAIVSFCYCFGLFSDLGMCLDAPILGSANCQLLHSLRSFCSYP